MGVRFEMRFKDESQWWPINASLAFDRRFAAASDGKPALNSRVEQSRGGAADA
jgi:hypothetical protein